MSASGNLWAVVPVKLFADTKRRLMPVLAYDERAALARTMLEDVLSVLTRTLSLAGIMCQWAEFLRSTDARGSAQ